MGTGFLKDTIKTSWNVELRAKNKYGKVLWVEKGHNFVLTKGRESTAILLGSADPNKRITKFGFGDAGHDPGTPTNPLPIDESGGLITDLNNRLLIKNIDSFDFPSPTQIRFTAQLLDVELVGVQLSEIGLFTEDETIFAVFNFGQIFHGAVIFEYRWTITIG